MRCLAALLAMVLASPALAEVRPLPRPEAILAFAGATELAPRATPRPLRDPGLAPVPAMVPADLARRLATEPAFAPVPAGALRVTVSASNAPRMPDAAAAVQAAFTRVAGPGLRPRLRPDVQAAAFVIGPRLRPAPRPPLAEPQAMAAPPPANPALVSPRPMKRPTGLALPDPGAQVVKVAAVRVKPGEQLVVPKRGKLCGDGRIKGERLPPIPARVQGCGLAEPVRVTEVDGVRLSPAATIDCKTARTLTTWVSDALKPAVGRRGVAQLQVASSYACRTRNNVRGARISEHGRGRAIDISAVVLGNGQVVDVLHSYHSDAGRFLRAAHKAACGIFGTTLGPGSDGYHENHLHFDTASYRSGSYCR